MNPAIWFIVLLAAVLAGTAAAKWAFWPSRDMPANRVRRTRVRLRLRVPVQESITITATTRAGKTGMLADLPVTSALAPQGNGTGNGHQGTAWGGENR